MNEEPFQRPNCPHEVDGFLHCRPRSVRRDGEDVDAIGNCVERIAGVEQARLALGPQHVPDVADAWDVAMDHRMLAAYRRDQTSPTALCLLA